MEYCKVLTEYLGRIPTQTDFTEEWALFFRKEDFDKYPEMHDVIDWRLKEHKAEFWKKHKPIFNGFDDFLKNMKKNQSILV